MSSADDVNFMHQVPNEPSAICKQISSPHTNLSEILTQQNTPNGKNPALNRREFETIEPHNLSKTITTDMAVSPSRYRLFMYQEQFMIDVPRKRNATMKNTNQIEISGQPRYTTRNNTIEGKGTERLINTNYGKVYKQSARFPAFESKQHMRGATRLRPSPGMNKADLFYMSSLTNEFQQMNKNDKHCTSLDHGMIAFV